MSDRRAPVKILLLVAPLLASVLALHAWGDAMAGDLGRRVEHWQYPEFRHAPFLIRAPRRSGDADRFAAPVLTSFVDQAIKAHGETLDLHPPAEPVPVTLLDAPDADRRRYGGDAAEFLEKHEGLFDPSRRAIVVRMDTKIDQERVTAALLHAAARLLLHDAGSARWSPWLTEGLAGVLEGSKAADLRAWTGDLPSLGDLITAREAHFRGKDGPAYARGARLFTAYLMETLPEGFATYYKATRAEGAVPISRVLERFADPTHAEALWKEWLQAQK
jgi:hypothetical protein